MKELTAYDYNKQEWVTGKVARLLLIDQLEQEMDLLFSDKGPDYFNSIKTKGSNQTMDQYFMALLEEHSKLASGK